MFPHSQLITPCKGVLSPESAHFSRGIWNTAQGIWIPLANDWNPEFDFHYERIRNQWRGIQNPKLSWITLRGVKWTLQWLRFRMSSLRASPPVMASEASSKRTRDRAANISFLAPGPHTRVSIRVRLSPDFSRLFQMVWRECSQASGYLKMSLIMPVTFSIAACFVFLSIHLTSCKLSMKALRMFWTISFAWGRKNDRWMNKKKRWI